MRPLLRLHLQDLSDQLGRSHLLLRLDLQRRSGLSGLLPGRLVLLRPSGPLLRLHR